MSDRPVRVGALLGLILFAIGSVPYVIAHHSCPGWTFSGVLGDWSDTKQHLSLIAQSQRAFVLPNVFTTDASRPFLVNLETLVGGLLMRLLRGDVIAVAHVIRLVGCLLFSIATVVGAYHFAPADRRALAITLAHFPWTLSIWPPTLAAPEWLCHAGQIDANSVLYALEQPQLAVAAGLIVLAIVSLDRFCDARATKMPWGAIVSVVVIWLDHPFEWWAVGFVYVLLVLQLGWRGLLTRASLVRCGLVGAAMASPVLLYVAANHFGGGGYTLLSRSFGNPWPLPTDVLLTVGATSLLALGVITRLFGATNDSPQQLRVLTTWFVGSFIAIYLPFAPWRWHQVNGLQVAAAFIAVRARLFDGLVATVGRRVAVCALCIVASLALEMPYLVRFARETTHCAAPYFYSAEDLAALDWLASHASSDDHVMCRGRFGLDVTLHSTARPYFAFVKKTLGWREKQPLVNRFFGGEMNDREAARLIDEAAITYILCELPNDARCTDARLAPLGITPLFSGDVTRLYKVNRPTRERQLIR